MDFCSGAQFIETRSAILPYPHLKVVKLESLILRVVELVSINTFDVYFPGEAMLQIFNVLKLVSNP